MLSDQIGPAFLDILSLIFGSYGVRQLLLAYLVGPCGEWIDKALPGAGGLMLGVLFACCRYRLVGS